MTEPTEKDRHQVNSAVMMLQYCSCLTMAQMELVECLVREGKYRHGVKRRIKMLGDKSDAVYKECCRVFRGEDSYLCDEFGRRSWKLFERIKEGVGFSGSEKWYQVICALSELIETRNIELEQHYYFKQAEYLYDAERRLSELGYKYNDVVQIIIKKL